MLEDFSEFSTWIQSDDDCNLAFSIRATSAKFCLAVSIVRETQYRPQDIKILTVGGTFTNAPITLGKPNFVQCP